MLTAGFCAFLGCFILVDGLPFQLQAVDVLTQHYDLARDGANLAETTLTPENVNVSYFGKLFVHSVDGQMYAEPLYVQGLTVSNVTRNVVFVCTENNSVYAFDADDGTITTPLWQTNLGTAVPYTAVNSCSDLEPVIGITGTPVIDTGTGTLYVDAKSIQVNGSVTNFYHYLHALDITTGHEKFGGPVLIQGTVNGIPFNAQHGNQRSGLLLLSNVVYVPFSSHCDWTPYNGWLFGYNATNLSQVAMFNTTPGSTNGEGAIWSGGMAPAADANGNIYVMTGNGNFNANTGGTNYGQCFIKFSTTNGLLVADWFSPFNEASLSADDRDLGTGGAVLIPGSDLLTGMGKNGTNYLLDQNHLGHFSTGNSDTNIVQEFLATEPSDRIGQSPVCWIGPTNEYIYMSTEDTNTLTYVFNGSTINTPAVAVGAVKQTSTPGGICLSANANTNGILWVIDSNNSGTLRAYDAANMPNELWDSQQDSSRDALGSFVKFCSPTVANGKVYAPSANQLVVYGLLSSSPPIGTLVWTAGGSDTKWSTAMNWTNITIGGDGPPISANSLLFTNTAAVASPGTVNNLVDTNFTITSLQYLNNTVNTSPDYQVTQISSGQTLVITNGLIVGTEADSGAAQVVNAVITGANGTLVLSNGLIAVTQGSGTDGPHQAVLNLSGLGTLTIANTPRLAIAVDGVPAQNGNGAQRCSGVLYLAQTNEITLTSTGVTNGILVGWNDSQGNGTSSGTPTATDDGSTLYLGQTNAIFTDAIYVGTDKTWGCLLAFAPGGLNNPVAYIRGIGGANSRVSFWGIGDTSMKSGSNQSCSGTNDFSGGTVDALVGNLNVGLSQTGASSGYTGNGTGVLTFSAGTMDVNSLTNGWSEGSGTTTGSDIGTGTVNVNGTALFRVNNTLALAESSGGGTGVPSGTLNVNGGTVEANSIVAGSGTSTITLNNATLIVTNQVGSPTAPIGSLSLTGSTLHLRLNGAAISTNIVATSLVAGGVNTIVVDSVVNLSGVTTFPIIGYSGTAPASGTFVKGTLPAGFAANLVNNTAQKRVDLAVAPVAAVTPHINAIAISGTNLIFGGTNGFPSGFYSVRVSTNLTLPFNQWTPLTTNPFDGTGGFNFTNPMDPASVQLYYLLLLQ